MTWSAALFVLAICTGLSLLVCVPVMLILRRRRGKQERRGGPAARPPRKDIPTHELPGLLAGMVVLFLGYAQAYIAPDTWFGQQMSTNDGRIVFGIGLYLAHAGATAALRRIHAKRP